MSTFLSALAATASTKEEAETSQYLAGPARRLAVLAIEGHLTDLFGARASTLDVGFLTVTLSANSDGDPFDRAYYKAASRTGEVHFLVEVYRPRTLYGEKRDYELRKLALRSPKWHFPLSPARAARALDG